MTRIFESSENGGMHPEVPGYSGAIRALLADDGTVLEVVPYGSPFSSEKEGLHLVVTSENPGTITITGKTGIEDDSPVITETIPVVTNETVYTTNTFASIGTPEEVQPEQPVEPTQEQPVEQVQPVEEINQAG